MTLLVLSFLAGVLTVAAPCTITLLPVIVGGSLVRSGGDQETSWKRPLIITASLGLSVILFTLLLKFSTALLGIPNMVWQTIAGGIILILGITFLWPGIWERFASTSGLYLKSNRFLGKSYTRKGFTGDVMTGLALGPVFSSCNPTYAFVVASVLPRSFAEGFAYLVAYALGLSSMLLLVSYLGQNFAQKLGWLQDPGGTFRKVIGILFIIVGLAVATGYDKKAETFIIDHGLYGPISNFEQDLRR
ncbi:MAG TPA: cytochrome c biogenesis protein CcdA [Candidatus Saccharimonadales bacterium]|nr:cytochrome c biogenesis protein CcdA [Candidatus Saccharimonadales bacterium]